MCEQNPSILRRPFKDNWIRCVPQTHILNADNIQIGIPSQQTTQNIVVEIFIRHKEEHFIDSRFFAVPSSVRGFQQD